MQNTKKIGVDVKLPTQKCEDKHCPFHGTLKVRGKIFTGIITKGDTHKTATVEWSRLFYLPKYERYERRRTRIKVHNPSCINAKIGSTVKIMECKPISKTKNFVIIERVEENESN